MERRAERFVKRVIEQKGRPLFERPKKAARLAGELVRRVKHSKGNQFDEIDERKHLREHEGLEQLDLELATPEGVGEYKVGDQIENSISIPRYVRLSVEVSEREEPDPDLEWNTDHAVIDINQLSLEDLRGRKKAMLKEEKELRREPLAED